jgi:TPR repeat protein
MADTGRGIRMANAFEKLSILMREEHKTGQPIHVLQEAAQSGDTEAKFRLGMLYYQAIGVEYDSDLAQHWLTQADADQHVRASYYIGRLCTHNGDPEAAMTWYHRGAELGFSPAMARIARNYFIGNGVIKSESAGFEYLVKGMKAGNYAAHAQYARMLIMGRQGILRVPIGIWELFRVFWRLYVVNQHDQPRESKERMLM